MTVLLSTFDEAYDRKGWHGTNLRGSVRGLTAHDALRRPRTGAHNIWELAVHAAYWKHIVRKRLTGAKRSSFPLKGSNWFESPAKASDEEWRDVVAMLESEHQQLRGVITAMTNADLQDPKKLRLVYGAAAHDTYHAGQIQLIKRLRR